MEDRIARAMAMDAAGGASVDAYTMAETDALLDGKVDAVQGKGLSENDYTDAEKLKLAGAAPQATTYTKSQVDAALAAKLNTADVDAALSSTSTNPVQNKAVRAPIARLVNAGAKNLINVGDKTLSVSGYLVENLPISIPKNDYCLTVNSSNNVQVLVVLKKSGQEVSRNTSNYMSGKITISISPLTDADTISVWINLGGDVSSVDLTNIMLCTAEDHAISPEIVPYAPSNRELYEEVEKKASLEDILGVGTTITNNANMDSLTGIGKWYCVNAPTAVTVTNAPFTDAAYFGWTIRSIASSDRYVQIAIKNSDDFVIAKRRYSGVWSAWSYLTGTAVT